MKNQGLVILIGIFISVFSSCEKSDNNNESNNESNIRIDVELISELNSKSYETLVIGSNSFVLDALIWRDFMPISPSNGKPMISINWLREIDSTDIPTNIDLVKQYVIYGDSIWISEYENESQPIQPKYKIEKISREGPKWGPKIHVDVISKVHDSKTNNDYFIRVKNIYIVRTD